MIYRIVDVASVAVIALPITWVFLALRGNWSIKRACLLSVFAVYLCVMFDVVGIPACQYFRWEPAVNLIPFGDEKSLRFFFQIGMNAVMFLPFGFLLPVLWGSCRSWKVTLLAGFLTSALIEFLQLFSFRATDVDDLLMNTLGAFLGFLLAWVCFHRKWQKESGNTHLWDMIAAILIPLLVILFLRTPISDWIYGLPLFQ